MRLFTYKTRLRGLGRAQSAQAGSDSRRGRLMESKERTMHRRTCTLSLAGALAATLFTLLALLAPAAARAAAVNYTFQPLAQIGGMAGEVPGPHGPVSGLEAPSRTRPPPPPPRR